MIELRQFPTTWDLQPSPFCHKVETYLRLAGIPFRGVDALPFRAPKGKLPVIVEQGRTIADSGLIIAHLEATGGNPLDGGLTAEQRSLGHLIRRTCEESLYFALVYSRWVDEAGWAVVKPAFFGKLPPGLRQAIPLVARRSVVRSLHAQGYGRHSRDEIYALGIADIDAVASRLEPGRFVLGDRPSTVDATVHAFLRNIAVPPIDSPLRRHALSLPAVAAYLRHVDKAISPP